jgi:hypothetical protein
LHPVAQQIWQLLTASDRAAGFADGSANQMWTSLEQAMRRHGEALHAWFMLGVSISELEASTAAGEDQAVRIKRRDAALSWASAAHMDEADTHDLFATVTTAINDGVNVLEVVAAWFQSHGAARATHLEQLSVIHARNEFPPDRLLRQFGCNDNQISYLQFLYARRPEPATDGIAATQLNLDRSTIAKCRRGIPEAIGKLLLKRHGKSGTSWCTPEV